MRIKVFLVGKTTESYIKNGLLVYLSRLKRYAKIEWNEIPIPKIHGKLPYEVQKKREADILKIKLREEQEIILLDEIGEGFSSKQFANFIEKKSSDSVNKICFVIGGSFGFSDKIKALADKKIALSVMTFPHQLVRLIFVEQLYRAFTINNNEKYHH